VRHTTTLTLRRKKFLYSGRGTLALFCYSFARLQRLPKACQRLTCVLTQRPPPFIAIRRAVQRHTAGTTRPCCLAYRYCHLYYAIRIPVARAAGGSNTTHHTTVAQDGFAIAQDARAPTSKRLFAHWTFMVLLTPDLWRYFHRQRLLHPRHILRFTPHAATRVRYDLHTHTYTCAHTAPHHTPGPTPSPTTRTHFSRTVPPLRQATYTCRCCCFCATAAWW